MALGRGCGHMVRGDFTSLPLTASLGLAHVMKDKDKEEDVLEMQVKKWS